MDHPRKGFLMMRLLGEKDDSHFTGHTDVSCVRKQFALAFALLSVIV